jgi:hypothetical protein
VSTAQADGPAALYDYDKTDGKTKEKFSYGEKGRVIVRSGNSIRHIEVPVDIDRLVDNIL